MGRSDASIDLRNVVSGQRRRVAAAPSHRKQAAATASAAEARRHEFTPEDDVVVVRCVAVQGTDWAHVATLQPLGGGVTAADVERRWLDCLEPALMRRLPGATDEEAAHFAWLREEWERLAGRSYDAEASLPLDLRSGSKRKRRADPAPSAEPLLLPEPLSGPPRPPSPPVIDLVGSEADAVQVIDDDDDDEHHVTAIVITKHRGRRVDLSAHFKKRKHKHHHCKPD